MQKKYKSLKDAAIKHGDKVLLRVDFNVPVRDGLVQNDVRIQKTINTILFLKAKGARIILVSHIESVSSLKPVSDYLQSLVPHTFVPELFGAVSDAVLSGMKDEEVVLLENIRSDEREKENDSEFSELLASLAQVYVNDAFSVSHREHASVVGVTKFLPSYMGLALEEELLALDSVLSPEKPLVFVLGGAKFETKIPLIKRFLPIASKILIGGALANDVYRERGFPVGNSLVSQGVDLSFVKDEERIVVPESVVVKRSEEFVECAVSEVESEDVIIDASPVWVRDNQSLFDEARTILWNGPLGLYEGGGEAGTVELAKVIAERRARSVIGGGDTLTAVFDNNLESSFSFISTGGGAMLDYLSSGTLPGLEPLKIA